MSEPITRWRRRGRITTVDAGHRTADRALLDRAVPPDLAGDPWRALRILAEFVEGFDALSSIPRALTVFGSARTSESDPMYQVARNFGAAAAGAGFAVITGGGPGIMEAANRGCVEAGGVSVGCNIELPFEHVRRRPGHLPGLRRPGRGDGPHRRRAQHPPPIGTSGPTGACRRAPTIEL